MSDDSESRRTEWTDARLDDHFRIIDPVAGMVTHHEGELDALRAMLRSNEAAVRGGFKRIEDALRQIHTEVKEVKVEVKQTNGRVTALEQDKAVAEALRAAAADAVEERRKNIALRLAAHGWIRPTLAAVLGGGVVTIAIKLVFG